MAEPHYMSDPNLSWAAVGLMAYLTLHNIRRIDVFTMLALNRAAYLWHPNDRGDLESAWDVLAAEGYVERCADGSWAIQES